VVNLGTTLALKAPLDSPTFTGTVVLPTAVTLAEASTIGIGTTTGTKFGAGGTSKIGFFGVTAVVRPTALTQTYSTASATHAAVTQLAAPAGGTGAAAGGWSTAANRDLAITSINAARTDIANLKNFVNQVVDQLQALGLLQ
jgi:invasion protein IalB